MHEVKCQGFAVAVLLAISACTMAQTQRWPSFRGERACGIGDGSPLPIEWDVESGAGVAWRTPIPGLAHSSPVVWDDMVFVTTAVKDGDADLKVGLYGSIEPVDEDDEHRFDLYCIDASTGAIRWSRTAHTGIPAVKRHPKGSHAASSPATNGTHVVAFFASEGLYCYDIQGVLQWERQFGVLDSGFFRVPTAQWGFASSPVIHDDMVLIQCDVQGQSFVAALDLETGEDRWRTNRDEVPTWGSPTIDVREGRSQVIVNGWKHIGGYDLATGAELWKIVGGGDIPVPTPVVAHDLVFIMSAHGGQAPIYAVDAMARGTVDPSDTTTMHWRRERFGNYMQTPLVYGDELYGCSDAGILRCYDARTGEDVYRQRLGAGQTGFSASMVGGDGKLYATSEEGEVHVVRAGRTFELLAVNSMGETCMASPAIAGPHLFFRTRHHLVAVGAPIATKQEQAP
ncbi:MAG: outer membrane protein assembly factor BamB family protein [Planctomycetota bacterium]|jgi:outer membrane protein assembly factor BamB